LLRLRLDLGRRFWTLLRIAFLSALVASLQAVPYAQGVLWRQKACRAFCQPSRKHVEHLAAAAIFRHGLPKMMSKKYENVELLSKKSPSEKH
jgi:hypothetical protein